MRMPLSDEVDLHPASVTSMSGSRHVRMPSQPELPAEVVIPQFRLRLRLRHRDGVVHGRGRRCGEVAWVTCDAWRPTAAKPLRAPRVAAAAPNPWRISHASHPSFLPALALSLLGGALAAQTYPAKPDPVKPSTTTPATTPVMPPAAVARTPARGSELVGRRVVDANDKVLGSISDLVIPDAGGVIALVKCDSVGLVCVPMSALQPKLKSQDATTSQGLATAKVDTFVFTQDRE